MHGVKLFKGYYIHLENVFAMEKMGYPKVALREFLFINNIDSTIRGGGNGIRLAFNHLLSQCLIIVCATIIVHIPKNLF